jgi:hypothetical protein
VLHQKKKKKIRKKKHFHVEEDGEMVKGEKITRATFYFLKEKGKNKKKTYKDVKEKEREKT